VRAADWAEARHKRRFSAFSFSRLKYRRPVALPVFNCILSRNCVRAISKGVGIEARVVNGWSTLRPSQGNTTLANSGTTGTRLATHPEAATPSRIMSLWL